MSDMFGVEEMDRAIQPLRGVGGTEVATTEHVGYRTATPVEPCRGVRWLFPSSPRFPHVGSVNPMLGTLVLIINGHC